MGKKNRKKNKKVSANGKPIVSILTPTYNRRKFIPFLIRCVKDQTYPSQLIEWVVVDDGEDCVEDLFKDISGVKYIRLEKKMKLGAKRNFMMSQAKGEIFVYMDDDDYYPPDRVNDAVNKLRGRPQALAAGSSLVYLYFKHLKQIWSFGPYGQSHATAGTFALKREILLHTRFNEEAEVAEEKEFLKNYTIPFVQLNPKKCILVFAHQFNTFDKKKLIANGPTKYAKPTNLKVDFFIKDKEMRDFYINQ